MKKILLSAFLLGSVAMASDYNYEVTPLVGYNFAEGNIGLDDYAAFGGEFQYNGFDSVIKPELSVIYSKADFSESGLASDDTDLWRFALNGVYEYEEVSSFTPFAKAGIGYENMSDTNKQQTGNTNSMYADLGLGVKVPFTKQLALKLEAIYMLKDNDTRHDSNLLVLAGLNFAFGAKAPKAAPVAPVVEEAAPVDGDDDHDGVLNSQDNCIYTPAGVKVDALGCALPAPVVVDNDSDKDGVLNADDVCPQTPLGEEVNSEGCPIHINLHIQFENDSADIKTNSQPELDAYAVFLKKHTNYNAKIVGYTDSRGSAQYNQKLSLKRAQAVVADLVSKGVDAKQLSAKGAGEANPIATNDTAEGRAQNRRIESELTKN
jgi:OOP family OmpA-OmpF porin